MSYRGETDAKRVSRILLFNLLFRCPKWLEWADHGTAVILAGDGGDLRALRSLGWPANNIVCADLDAERVRRAREIWPEVDTRHCDIRAALQHLPRSSISLAVLDFCGHLTDVVRETMQLVGARIRLDACVSLTYLRGREGTHTPQLRESRALVSGLEAVFRRKIPAAVRMEQYRRTGYIAKMQEWIEGAWWSATMGRRAMPLLIRGRGWVNYDSGHSPMGIAVVQATRALDEREALLSPDRVTVEGCSVDPSAPPDESVTLVVPGGRDKGRHRSFLRDEVLQKPRLCASELADWCNLSVGQIAAWRAVATREHRRDVG